MYYYIDLAKNQGRYVTLILTAWQLSGLLSFSFTHFVRADCVRNKLDNYRYPGVHSNCFTISNQTK